METQVKPQNSADIPALYYSVFRGYICTANEDGSIPLSAQMVAHLVQTYDDQKNPLLDELLRRANAYPGLMRELEGLRVVRRLLPEIVGAK